MNDLKENKATVYELEKEVKNWTLQFNFINVNVLNKDNCLFEFIRHDEPDIKEFMNNYDHWDEFWKYYLEWNQISSFRGAKEIEHAKKQGFEFYENCLKDFIKWKFEQEFNDYKHEKEDENYPMWNTCFEFKEEPSEQVVESAINAGFGVIHGMEYFNTTLFVSGCGYSFYGQHWIPLWLNLPWNSDKKEYYKDIDYSML